MPVDVPVTDLRASDLTRLAREGEVLAVRNTTDGPTVFQLDSNEFTEWAALGDPGGDDVKEIPSTYLKNAKFRQAILRGIFEVIDADSPELIDAIHAQRETLKARAVAREAQDRIIQAQQPRAISGIPCIAPDNGRSCSEFALPSGKNQSERPPLCGRHADLSSRYVSEETGKIADGKPEVQWVLVGLNKI